MKEWSLLLMGTLIGVAIGVIIFYAPVRSEGYKNGQLDYQRGIIKYELTETGYKEIVEVKE